MLVLSTITPDETIIMEMEQKFPALEFVYETKLLVNDDHLKRAEILITYGEDLTEKHIEAAKQLKWIMVMSAGLEKMPLQEINQKNIMVTNARGIHSIPMAEYTIGMLLQYEKKNKLLLEQEEKALWERRIITGELSGKTILIMGTGAIGGEIARLAKAFNMKTLGINRGGKQAAYIDELYKNSDLLNVIARADYITAILPSTPETKGMLGKEHFRKMKKTAVFINIGRGDLVEDSVLLVAMKNKEIAHSILDVFNTEPLPKDHDFWRMDNVTVTPHLSSKSDRYLPRSFDIFEKNLQEYMGEGKKYINLIDSKKGY
ncbi:D-2-hydroxyacid dehydrogenase [Peribacillus sp. B-H-3]|uniref:D-2-hydroxyacid dehydrogenase n=1 Tax=Peribacillus sp. B-H-3 TaxID=3400420 RepID=UPI003B0157CD